MARVTVRARTVMCVWGMLVFTTGCAGSSLSESGGDPPQRFDRLQLEISGGFGPAPCSNGKDSFTVTQAPAHLTWTGCDYDKTPAEAVMGDRALSDTELGSVNDAFHGVALSTAKTCGADAALLTLDVTTSQGVERYADDFYSGCPWDAHAGRTFVTGLGKLGSVLEQLSKP